MVYNFTDYIITQSGQELKTENPIKIQKCENKVSRLVFKVEDKIKENARLYCAILNPLTKRYHYEPLLYDEELDAFYLIIGTSISYYVGKIKILLIAVEPQFILDDNITFDPSAAIYVSKEFVRVVVLENFLDDIAVEVSMPNLDRALDNFMVLHDNVVEIAIQTAQDLVDCNEALKQCEEAMAQCDFDMEWCETDLERCEDILDTCQKLEESCSVKEELCDSHVQESTEILRQNTATLQECNTILTQARNVMNECNSAKSACTSASASCTNALRQANAVLVDCQNILAQINTLRRQFEQDYQSKMNNMRTAYENYMASMAEESGGEP